MNLKQISPQLEKFQQLLLKWNARINLIGKNSEGEVWNRHIMDSLQVAEYIPDNRDSERFRIASALGAQGEASGVYSKTYMSTPRPKRDNAQSKNEIVLADFGSGAGLPGLIIAIARPEVSVHLIESDARKCAFLREAKAQLKLSNVTIRNERIEKIPVKKFDIITARAFADLSTFLKLSLPFQQTNCLNILLKGSNLPSEIVAAEKIYDFKIEIHQSKTDPSGKIAVITNIKEKL